MRMSDWSSDVCSSDLVAALAPASAADFVRIEGGTFEMGSEEFYREEGPVRQVTVRPFLISSTEVTNADFAAFVAADRTSVVWGKSVSVRVDLGGRRIIKKKITS